jgi:Fe-S cluster assembly protein SufD
MIKNISTTSVNTIIHPLNLISIGENAQVKIIESFETISATAKTACSALTEIVVDKDAIVDYYKIEDEKELRYLVNTTQVIQQRQSVFSNHTFTLSGSLVRNNLTVVLDDEHIESHLNRVYFMVGNQVLDRPLW